MIRGPLWYKLDTVAGRINELKSFSRQHIGGVLLLLQGLYEQVIDRCLRKQLDALDAHAVVESDHLDDGDSHSVLARHLSVVLSRALDGIHGADRLAKQIDVCNKIIGLLAENHADIVSFEQLLSEEGKRLLAILKWTPPVQNKSHGRPDTPLSVSCLLTGTRIDPSLISQLRRELLTADHVSILCSFIKWSGIRILEDELRAFTSKPGSALRIITTSYMGATDLKAVEFLRELPNTDLKLSYDTRRTRLHAKAYIFHRNTGFGTAYIGSANLSNAALTDGLEWNVKVSEYESSHLWDKVCATFDTYWNDAEFTPYTAADRERLSFALSAERAGATEDGFAYQFDIRPYPYQQEILDKLEAERAFHKRFKNLVVAATGTGKTVIAAFDYKRFRHTATVTEGHNTARLLFVAHREEILQQSLACFRAVLRDQNFGDLLVGAHQPDNTEQLFVSIQSYNAQRLWEQIPGNYYDFVVIDEFHHAEALSYQRLIDHIQPRLLLGLTATPERGDGQDILHHFDGHVSAEIRLPTAINRKLLCPFQYFGITDTVDLNRLTWQRGGYHEQELDRQYTGNDARANLVVRSVRAKLLDVHKARGLGFCVSVAHAQYMAEYFCRAGIPAVALSAQTPREQRQNVQGKLIRREINFIFVVDLYNEGVDIPEIDTVLFLRPTESLTVFLQQLGRGLRLHEEKDCLTVLDFIGQAHRNYNFEMRFRSLMDNPKRRIDQEIEDGCLHLPLGCIIQLERIAQRHILDNIHHALTAATASLTQRLASFTADTGQPPTMARFLDYYELNADDIYRRKSWTRLCIEAGIRGVIADPDEKQLTRGLRRVAHINGPMQIQWLTEILESYRSPGLNLERLDTLSKRILLMLHFSLWRDLSPATLAESVDRLRRNPAHYAELIELLAYKYDKLATVPPELTLPFACPLELHASYTRDEILAALGHWTLEAQPALREGVLHLPERADVFFVTLNKTERDYSPTTMYADYAINETLFHWQSQSTTSERSATGQRYIHHVECGHTILLFVREDKTRNGLTCPYEFLGPVIYESHTGSRPMSITWRLEHAIPARLLPMARRLAVA
jgi:superfamily II DNA or RNA helicase